MKIFSWNVNGIRAIIQKGEFQKFIKKYQPDILCLQETKAKRGQAEIDLPGYEEFWNDADRAGYSGTAIFTKIQPLSVRYGFSDTVNQKYNFTDKFGDASREGRVTTAEFEDFFLVTQYTPNAKTALERLNFRHNIWDPAFLEYVKELENIKPVIFCGDLNVAHREIDLARPKENHRNAGFTDEERAGFQNYIDAGFIDTFRQINGDIADRYTWWSYRTRGRERNVGWRIDYFVVSKAIADRVKNSEIFDEQMGSDHCPVGIVLE